MDVTREDFEAYEDVRISGVTNMFDVRAVESYSGLPREVILDIMEHYSTYKKWLYERKYAYMGKVTTGMHGIGTVLARYDDIVAVYGKPFTRLPENKIDVEWIVETTPPRLGVGLRHTDTNAPSERRGASQYSTN